MVILLSVAIVSIVQVRLELAFRLVAEVDREACAVCIGLEAAVYGGNYWNKELEKIDDWDLLCMVVRSIASDCFGHSSCASFAMTKMCDLLLLATEFTFSLGLIAAWFPLLSNTPMFCGPYLHRSSCNTTSLGVSASSKNSCLCRGPKLSLCSSLAPDCYHFEMVLEVHSRHGLRIVEQIHCWVLASCDFCLDCYISYCDDSLLSASRLFSYNRLLNGRILWR